MLSRVPSCVILEAPANRRGADRIFLLLKAEIFFEKNKRGIKFLGHAWVKKSEYKTKKEILGVARMTHEEDCFVYARNDKSVDKVVYK